MHSSDFSAEDEYIYLDDSRWNELIELTQGAVALCYQCGVCTAICPWGLFTSKSLPIRSLIRRAQLGKLDKAPGLWLCTTCDQCSAYCPRGVDVSKVIRALRSVAWNEGQPQPGLPSLLWSIYWNNNPWSQPPSQRENWAKDLDIPNFDPTQHEILLYVGCTPSYDRRAQKITLALVKIFESSGVSFGYLGAEEPCCGESVLSVGHLPYFEEIAFDTTEVFNTRGVTDMVTISPHCYDVFKNHYTDFGESIKPIHYTQYLEGLLDEGRLTLSNSLNMRTTFQDPCYLGRHNRVYDIPRKVIAAISGVDFVEMADCGADGLCCGGGGGRMWLETVAGERFSDLRIQQALDVEADVLVTACPFCIVCLEDSVKSINGCDMQVMDLAEFIVNAL